jgi:hypothetical protein
MTQKEITAQFKHHVLNKRLFFLAVPKFLADGQQVTVVYLFSYAISLIEKNHPLENIVQVMLLWITILVVSDITKVTFREKMRAEIESRLIDLRDSLLIKARYKNRVQTIQAVRNYTESVRGLTNYIIEPGLQGIFYAVAIPVILYFVNFEIFLLEIAFIITYLFIAIRFGKYLKIANENFDTNKEIYYSKLIQSNNVKKYENRFKEAIIAKYKVVIINWITLDNLTSLFIFAMIVHMIFQVVKGEMFISDLVLVATYLDKTKLTLIRATTSIDLFEEISASAERLEIDTTEKINHHVKLV